MLSGRRLHSRWNAYVGEQDRTGATRAPQFLHVLRSLTPDPATQEWRGTLLEARTRGQRRGVTYSAAG